jgi:hypothetical protein
MAGPVAAVLRGARTKASAYIAPSPEASAATLMRWISQACAGPRRRNRRTLRCSVFAKAEDVDTFCDRFGGERLPGRGHQPDRWRDSTNEERLNGENGLLLTPSIDHLFDRGFISFEDSGTLIISPVAHRLSLQRMGIDITKVVNVGGFTSGQKQFLDFHRNSVLLQSIRA